MPVRKIGPPGMLIATKSHFGWVLAGRNCPLEPSTQQEKVGMVNRISLTDETDMAVRHWELEHIGILPRENSLGSTATKVEEEAMKQHKEKAQLVDGRFKTGLLMRSPEWNNVTLQSNKANAVKRLKGLER
jgi:hypothetical protein